MNVPPNGNLNARLLDLESGFGINNTISKPHITVDRVNYYLNVATGAFADDLLSETKAYIARVVADGGYVVDPYLVNRAYAHAKTYGYLTSIMSWLMPSGGVKLSTSTTGTRIEKLYDLSAEELDIYQSTPGKRGYFVENSLNGKNSLYLDGTNFYEMTNDAVDQTKDISALYFNAVTNIDFNGVRKTLLGIDTGVNTARFNVELERLAAKAVEVGGRRLDANSYDYASAVATELVGNWGLLAAMADYANAKAYTWENGSNIAYDSAFQTTGNTSNVASSRTVKVGAATTSTSDTVINPFKGSVAEIMMIKNDSNPQLEFLHERLTEEYGIVFPEYNNILLAQGNQILTYEEV